MAVYRDWHAPSGSQFLKLPELRAALAYGRVQRLRGPEFAVWALRLLVEAGLVPAATVRLPELHGPQSASVSKVYAGFRLLLGCKWLHSAGEPTPYSWRFASAWCGVGERQAGLAMQVLMREGILRPAGRHKRMTLFLPGRASTGH